MDISDMVEVTDVKELLASLRVVPGGLGADKVGFLSLSIGVDLLKRVISASGVASAKVHKRFPAFWVRLPQVVLENMKTRGVYSERDTPAYWDRHYYFDLCGTGRLSVRYQQISGGWLLAELPAEEVDAWVLHLATLVKEAYAHE